MIRKDDISLKNDIIEQLEIRAELKNEILEFRKQYPVKEQDRIPNPDLIYDGKDIWEQAVTALLCGKNVLLVGQKATGKNLLAENLAAAFARPRWDISFHVNMDAASLIGTDTFCDGAVAFRPGPVYAAAKQGGFAVLDEINMAKSEAVAVLHAVLDFRRSMDIPGYGKLALHPATRLIATMNYGYSGTRELNEALVSRFVVIEMPLISGECLARLLQKQYPSIKKDAAEELTAVFLDLRKKCEHGELSSKALDLRGLLDAVALMEKGMHVDTALDMGITNKSFDPYEQALIRDTIHARMSRKLRRENLFCDELSELSV